MQPSRAWLLSLGLVLLAAGCQKVIGDYKVDDSAFAGTSASGGKGASGGNTAIGGNTTSGGGGAAPAVTTMLIRPDVVVAPDESVATALRE
jgi:hypothetical protein